MEIKILNFKKVNGDGLLKALVDISIDGWTLKALRVTAHNGRKPYVASSRCGIRDPDTGHLTFEQIVYCPPDIWKTIEDTILKRYEKENESNGTDGTETN